jgi:DNA-binding NarL/FixJ family response regulator
MRVMLADSHTQIRWALRTVIEEEPGLILIGEASDAQNLLLEAESQQPELILLEWELPGRANGFLSELRGLSHNPQVIVLSNQPQLRESVLAAGAEAFVSKADAPEQLLGTLRRLVKQREKPVDSQTSLSGSSAPASTGHTKGD